MRHVVALIEIVVIIKHFFASVEHYLFNGAFLRLECIKIHGAKAVSFYIEISQAAAGIGELQPLKIFGVAEGVGLKTLHAELAYLIGLVCLGSGIMHNREAVAGIEHAVVYRQLLVPAINLKSLQVRQIRKSMVKRICRKHVFVVCKVAQMAVFCDIHGFYAGSYGFYPVYKIFSMVN